MRRVRKIMNICERLDMLWHGLNFPSVSYEWAMHTLQDAKAEIERLHCDLHKAHEESGQLETALDDARAEAGWLRGKLERYETTYDGWKVCKECDDGSLILESHTGNRRHIWRAGSPASEEPG